LKKNEISIALKVIISQIRRPAVISL